MFETFGAYMYSLLVGSLRRVTQPINAFYIFLNVVGKLFDKTKQDILRVREESMVISCSDCMLAVHGDDRDMPRLHGETTEAYRTRLCMKGIISEKAGTREGILLTVRALGYDQSTLEPCYVTEPEAWAEFWIHLSGKVPSSIGDILVIDSEIQKVKEASAKVRYALETKTVMQDAPFLSVVAATENEFTTSAVSGVYPITREQILPLCCGIVSTVEVEY